MKNYKMWIGGKWVDAVSGQTYTTLNPATEEAIGTVSLGDNRDVDLAVEAARRAFPVWSKKSIEERSLILNRINALIQKRLQEFMDVDILGHGTPVNMATMLSGVIAHAFEGAAELGKTVLEAGSINPNFRQFGYLQREPIGVCGIIEPWNVPFMIGPRIATALAVGNTCVVKPPSICSLTALKYAEILAEVEGLTPGAVNIITGPGGTVGEAIASHPGVGGVFFTGSNETGKAIMAAASKTVKRVSLELGGKNPFIVLDDADINAAMPKAINGAYFNTGMICGAPGRFYIHEKIYSEFVERFIAESKKVVVGDPADKKTFMGPVVSAEHRDRVENYIRIGIQEGAKLALGGKRPIEPPLNKGYYMVPTVFVDVAQNMRIAREEIFGPVAVFLKFSSDEEVLKMANDSIYGLTSSVWTRNLARGKMFAREIQAGTVSINNHASGSTWGGYKQSGFGKTNGILGQEEFTQVKAINID
jgi:betaine-aldehyde dehydrogenase